MSYLAVNTLCLLVLVHVWQEEVLLFGLIVFQPLTLLPHKQKSDLMINSNSLT